MKDKKKSVFSSKVRVKPGDEQVDAASLKTRIRRYLALFVITLKTTGRQLLVATRERHCIFKSYKLLFIVHGKYTPKWLCLDSMFTLRRIKTFSQSSAYTRHIHKIASRKCVYFRTIITRGHADKNIFY